MMRHLRHPDALRRGRASGKWPDPPLRGAGQICE